MVFKPGNGEAETIRLWSSTTELEVTTEITLKIQEQRHS